jgi:hypothetical protein
MASFVQLAQDLGLLAVLLVGLSWVVAFRLAVRH